MLLVYGRGDWHPRSNCGAACEHLRSASQCKISLPLLNRSSVVRLLWSIIVVDVESDLVGDNPGRKWNLEKILNWTNSHHSVGRFSADAFIAFHVDDARTGILAGEASPTLRGRVSIANNMTLDKLWMVAHPQTFGLIFFCKTDPGIEKTLFAQCTFLWNFLCEFWKTFLLSNVIIYDTLV